MVMSPPNSPQEIAELSAWCLAILEFLNRKAPSPLIDQMKDVVLKTTQNGDANGLRSLNRDLAEWAASIPSQAVVELNAILKERFGRDLTVHSREAKRTVTRALKAGRIESDLEFELLERYVAGAAAGDVKVDLKKIARINELLRTYSAQ